ncbi:MAG: protein kinase [Actinomycetota bacterium]|nr:protein kinase [Actinomycetota bacterium]
MIAGRYRVVRSVGRGGMGVVWLCHDERLHRDVAVKRAGAMPGESPEDTARAMREARVAAALNHKNAVSIYDVVEHDGGTWLVMEYVPSRTLSELVKAEGPLPPHRVAHIGMQVAAALTTAHVLGIVHRDVKPGNILVTEDDAAKISDFGIARGDKDHQLTQTGMVSGTPAYFSPELARGEGPSPASDVWALGATLFTALEGAPPYQTHGNALAMLSRIAQGPVPTAAHAGALAEVMAQMLEPDPSRRCTMGHARAVLAGVADRGPASVTMELPVRFDASDREDVEDQEESGQWSSGWSSDDDAEVAPPEDDRRARSPSWWLPASVALALLLVVGLVLWSLVNSDARHQGSPQAGGSHSPGTTHTPKRSHPPAKSPTSARTSSPSQTPRTTPTGGPTSVPPTSTPKSTPVASGSQAAFVQSYYANLPGNLDAGWARLSPSFQAQLGRGSYDGFWNTIGSVDVLNVSVVSPTAVDYTITYHPRDGRGPSTEHKEISVEPSGHSFLITGDRHIR